MLNLDSHWYRNSTTFLMFLLLPVSLIFRFIVYLRRVFYKLGILKVYQFSVPIIVIGNISVGGTGKTPFVIWLADFLKQEGYHPGIVSRGFGGEKNYTACCVNDTAKAENVGDEALLLAKRTRCPMVVCVDRVAAVKLLLEKYACNIVISDDGLQHYRLGRDIEIAIVDGARRFGNGFLLPAGPLREPVSRLKSVDFIVAQQTALDNEYLMELEGSDILSVIDESERKPLTAFEKVHAVTAIGNPTRFFASLRAQQIEVIEHIFPDHYLYTKEDFKFNDEFPIIMTEKDSVKCKAFATNRFWFLPVTAKLNPIFSKNLKQRVAG